MFSNICSIDTPYINLDKYGILSSIARIEAYSTYKYSVYTLDNL